MKNTFRFFAVLMLVSACSPAESPAPEPQREASVGPEDAQHEAREQPALEETLPSLEDLLPAHFGVLTRPWHGDLDGMVERRAIRVLVVSGGPQFFYSNGKPRGIMVELLVRFRDQLNERLGRGLDAVEIIAMPVSRDRLIPALLSGRADLIAADLTITERRSALIDFSSPLVSNVNEVPVFAPGSSGGVNSIDDLAGRSVYVRESSSYFEHLTALNENLSERGLKTIQLQPANELLRTQDIVEMVHAGVVDATVLDSYRARFWKQIFPDIEVRDDTAVNTGAEIAWAFRKDSPLLEEAVNDFVLEHRKGTLIGNILLKRYLENAGWIRNATNDVGLERLRPALDMFREGAEISGLDPLMLIAQAYQESGLDHSQVSPAGAVGIMQIKPSTAADRNVGFDDITSMEDNIHAGATYMRFLMGRYFAGEDMDDLHQWLFALAAYNAGPARIQRIRKQAASEGYDPNLWLENVELVAARQIGRETVNYVRNVFKYYVAYRMAWEERRLRREFGDLQLRDLDFGRSSE